MPAAPETPEPVRFDDADPATAYNRVWFNLLRIQRSMAPRISRALKGAGIEDPVWYEILLEVEKAGAAGIRMAELESRLFVAQYALSRHVSRIEAAGFLRRDGSDEGRRGRTLFITEKGLGLHANIWPAYGEAIQSELRDRLSTDEAYALCRLLIRLYP